MGSQLGLARAAPLPNDIVWLDPLDIQRGRLAALRLPASCTDRAARRRAVLLPAAEAVSAGGGLRRRTSTTTTGDCSIVQSGRALAARLRALRPARVAIVAHSMGGLVSRAALALEHTRHIERLVLLGTPNCGSFAAVQALRGTYAVVRKVARLAQQASAESLAAEVFNTFPSLYELLPWGSCSVAGGDLFDARSWPAAGPRPRVELLEAARATQCQLAPPDERFAVIAGVGAETVTAVRRRGAGVPLHSHPRRRRHRAASERASARRAQCVCASRAQRSHAPSGGRRGGGGPAAGRQHEATAVTLGKRRPRLCAGERSLSCAARTQKRSIGQRSPRRSGDFSSRTSTSPLSCGCGCRAAHTARDPPDAGGGAETTRRASAKRLGDRLALARIRQPAAAAGEVVLEVRELAGGRDDAGDRRVRGNEFQRELAPARGIDVSSPGGERLARALPRTALRPRTAG